MTLENFKEYFLNFKQQDLPCDKKKLSFKYHAGDLCYLKRWINSYYNLLITINSKTLL